jgi:hypothetical protein
MLDTAAGRTYVRVSRRAVARHYACNSCEGQMGSTSFGGAIPADVTWPASPQQKKCRDSLGRVSLQGPL